MRIGIFGGTFDPIHRGHLIVARAAADQLRLDRVHFIPARVQPFKAEYQGASARDRAAMVRLAIADEPRFVLDERELQRDGPSYTIDTLRAVRTERPGDELFLLVGADTARDLPLWREAAAVARLARVAVLTRPGFALPEHPLIGEIVAVPSVDVSATLVRATARRGGSIRDLVPPAVAEYIAARGLYRAERLER